jgi:hypothetical protein
MDKEQARFILRSFRPDGADVNDADFAEALALAMKNRELGEWLAEERAFDAAFANALNTVALPETLRQDILGCLSGVRDGFPQAEDSRDASFIGALASIQAPPVLREEILAAMNRTVRRAAPNKPLWRRFSMPLAAAAGVALAFFLTRGEKQVHVGPLPVDVVQAGFISAYESPFFSLDMKRDDQRVLMEHLKTHKLPCPGCLPPGLAKLKSIGCRELNVDGKRGSLLCFEESKNGTVHLVIFQRADVSGELPCCKHPSFVQSGPWATARWEDESHVFILVSKSDLKKLATLFG